MGYHSREIPKGILGELSKIEEEAAELADAFAQGNKLMALQELSDMYGAMEQMLLRRFSGVRMGDLAIMAHATRSAFLDGTRTTHIPQQTFQTLRERTTSIHFFGLGFIQIKLGVFERVHIYHPELPAFVDEPHDHRYDFHSTVLTGSLVNTLYEFMSSDDNQGADLYMQETSCAPDKKLVMPMQPVWLTGKRTLEVTKGQSYVLGRDQFHSVTTSSYCITALRRSIPCKEYARVVRRQGALVSCPFAKIIPEAQLWEYVEDAWKSV